MGIDLYPVIWYNILTTIGIGGKIMERKEELGITLGDVHWVYNRKTGAIPFIINSRATKVKQLEDGCIIDILPRNRMFKNKFDPAEIEFLDEKVLALYDCHNPATYAKNAMSDYYGLDMSYVHRSAIWEYVGILQQFRHFGAQPMSYSRPVTREQIEFLTENYNKKYGKFEKQLDVKIATQKAFEDSRAKTFGF